MEPREEFTTENEMTTNGWCLHTIVVKLLRDDKLVFDVDGKPCIGIQGDRHKNREALYDPETCQDVIRRAKVSLKSFLADNPWKIEYHPIGSLMDILENRLI